MGRRRENLNARADRELEELRRILLAYPFEYTSEEWVREQIRQLIGDAYPGWTWRVSFWSRKWELVLSYTNFKRVRRARFVDLPGPTA